MDMHQDLLLHLRKETEMPVHLSLLVLQPHVAVTSLLNTQPLFFMVRFLYLHVSMILNAPCNS